MLVPEGRYSRHWSVGDSFITYLGMESSLYIYISNIECNAAGIVQCWYMYLHYKSSHSRDSFHKIFSQENIQLLDHCWNNAINHEVIRVFRTCCHSSCSKYLDTGAWPQPRSCTRRWFCHWSPVSGAIPVHPFLVADKQKLILEECLGCCYSIHRYRGRYRHSALVQPFLLRGSGRIFSLSGELEYWRICLPSGWILYQCHSHRPIEPPSRACSA